MPILTEEPQIFPEDLFERNQDGFGDRRWWALHTRPRQEKSLARQLLARGIPFYLPQVSKRLRIRKRTFTVHEPLFASYIFLLAGPEERVTALTTNRIVRPIPVVDQRGLWHDLTQIHDLICSGVPITPEERLSPGKIVEIKSGPLAGLRGKIVDRASRRRFVVAVDFIHRGASVLLDDFTLAPAFE
jgi:transcriptional antiterminator RfaH